LADPVEPPSIPPSEGVARLAWSGIATSVVTFDVTQEEIGVAYLKHAGEVSADLLVKGAYARSRVRQMILGGRTRHIISHTEIPVFLSH
jgi:nucleotide-binding universal stress UspA family protein